MHVVNRIHRVRQSIIVAAMTIVSINLALAEPPAALPASVPPATNPATPSKLDYVVLASLVDASSLLSLTVYRTPIGGMAVAPKKAAALNGSHDRE